MSPSHFVRLHPTMIGVPQPSDYWSPHTVGSLMDPKDLLKLLDLGGAETSPPPAEPVVTSAESFPSPSPHTTALEVDEWGLRRGRELAVTERWRSFGLDDPAAADFFAAAFDPD